MRKFMSNYLLVVLMLVVTFFCFKVFDELFMRTSSPIAGLLSAFAGDLL